jgi:hypothetical protein
LGTWSFDIGVSDISCRGLHKLRAEYQPLYKDFFVGNILKGIGDLIKSDIGLASLESAEVEVLIAVEQRKECLRLFWLWFDVSLLPHSSKIIPASYAWCHDVALMDKMQTRVVEQVLWSVSTLNYFSRLDRQIN